MAISTTKTQISGYLWDWADATGDWAKMLAWLVLQTESHLPDRCLDCLYELFLISVGLSQFEVPQIQRPSHHSTCVAFQLRSLSDIQGVNRLAAEQTLEFAKNMTVVYGQNGSGKSGYGRILKALGLSYDRDNTVLRNVYSPEPPCEQTAKICYCPSDSGETAPEKQNNGNKATVRNHADANIETQIFQWDGSCICPDLSGISVFTNSCVSISLGQKRELLISPIGFHFFSVASDALDRLAQKHKTKIAELKTDITWIQEIHEGTPVHRLLSALDARTLWQNLEKLASFTEDDAILLQTLKNKRHDLNRNLISMKIAALQNQVRELSQLGNKIETAGKTFTSVDWAQLGKHHEVIADLTQKEQIGIKDIAERRGIEFYDSDEFLNFIRSAEAYLKKLGKENYPKDADETCIYCRQKLIDPDAVELLSNYRKMLNDKTESMIQKHKTALLGLEQKLMSIDADVVLRQASYGTDQENIPLQPEFLKDYQARITHCQQVVKAQDPVAIKQNQFDITFDSIVAEIEKKSQQLDEILASERQTLKSIEDEEKQLDSQINELLDREKLKAKIGELRTIMDTLKVLKVLQENSSSFNTRSLSLKASEARKDLISSNFASIFKDELKRLCRSDVKISLDFRTDKAKSYVLQGIGSQFSLAEVLSEGEQKAISLSEFLTELCFDETKAPVVFDDPVTSLDHDIIDEVAWRLTLLSEERQVIVFTHSILLFNSLKQKSELSNFKSLEYKYYETQTDLDSTGILHESPNLKEDSFNRYKTTINTLLNLPKGKRDTSETELAEKGYNNLRAAIEVTVETDILKSTVKRYRKNVALTKFDELDGELIDKHKQRLMQIFEKCCGYTPAHSKADGLNYEPKLAELKLDFDEVCSIRKDFVKN